MTVPRNYWSTSFTPGQQEVFIKNHWCFGWIVQQVIIPANSSMVVVSQNTLLREKAPNLALYVRGRASVTNDQTGTYPDREPGLFTKDRPEHPKGITTIKAIEETELWCFNYLINKRSLPQATKLFLPKYSTYTSAVPELLFVCSGKLNEYTTGAELKNLTQPFVAEEDTYLFKIENSRV